LSFEFSTPKQSLIIVNCGVPAASRDAWRQLARSTPTHSTVTFNSTSSARFVEMPSFRRMLGGSPIVSGPVKVMVSRDDNADAIVLRAAHDAYASRFGVIHERVLVLAADGTRLYGEDIFLDAEGSPQVRGTRDEFAVRFHLHPTVKVTRSGPAMAWEPSTRMGLDLR